MADVTSLSSRSDLRELVRKRYAERARTIHLRGSSGCGCCQPDALDAQAVAAYAPHDLRELPQDAVLASLGCGNPTALADLRDGEVVLDLGSGGGIDVLLSAKRVGPSGFAYGLDMTDEMLELAEHNREAAGVDNVKFLKGHIEEIPLPENSVDVIISNCVINLSGDKDSVLREAFRVLKPEGRFAVSDIVLTSPLPPSVQESIGAWSACIAGALSVDAYREKLASAGFDAIDVELTHAYEPDSLVDGNDGCCGSVAIAPNDYAAMEDSIYSAFIRATKPD